MKTKIQLKEEMQATFDLTSVVEVMKQVTSTHLHHLEKMQVRFDLFSWAIQEYFYWMNMKGLHHPFFESQVKARLTLVITSDAGFLGGLNTAILGKGLESFDPKRGDGLAVVGERGRAFLKDLGYKVDAFFPGISLTIDRQEIRTVKKFLVDRVLEGKYGGVSVVYPHYETITRQHIEKFDLFPCQSLPTKTTGMTEQPRGSSSVLPLEEYFILESPVEDLIAYLVELWTSERLYSLFWHSKLSELAARTLHLEESFQELSEEKKRLGFQYSKCIHELTDRNIREIVAARKLEDE